MKNMKKTLALLLAAISIVGMTACSSSTESTTTEAPATTAPATTAPAATETPAEAEDEVIVLQLAYENNPGEPIDDAGLEWQRLADEYSGGTVQIELFPSSQLGSKNDLMDQIVMGEPIITICDGSFLADYGAPELAIMSAPYLFTSWDQAWQVMETDWYAEQMDLLTAAGIHDCGGHWAYGERNLMTTTPVYSIDDMKGLIVRTPNTTSWMLAFEAMGASPTAMALGDVYTATSQGTIDGMENPFTTLQGAAYYEVAKYITMTKHVLMPTNFIMSQSVWESMSPAQQEAFSKAASDASDLCTKLIIEGQDQVGAEMEAEGVTIIDLTDEQRAEFQTAASVIYSDPAVTGTWRDGLYEMILAEIS